MHISRRFAARLNCRIGALAVATGFLLGCAATSGPSWANFKTDKAADTAAADDDFPSAAEVGLASSDKQPAKER